MTRVFFKTTTYMDGISFGFKSSATKASSTSRGMIS